MQRAGFDTLNRIFHQPLHVAVGVGALEVAKLFLFRDQPLRTLQIAIDEHVEPELQVGEHARVQVADFLHAGGGKGQVLADLLLRDFNEVLVDDVADVLQVDRKGDDVGPAPAFPFFQRVALPMLDAFWYFKQSERVMALVSINTHIAMYGPIDWLVAGRQWLERRQIRRTL